MPNAKKTAEILQRVSEISSSNNSSLKNVLNSTNSNLNVCSHNYQASNSQAPYYIDVAGLSAPSYNIVLIIAPSTHFSEK